MKPEKGEVDFWYSGCIDATLWWLIAVRFYDRCRPADGLARQLRDKVKRAFTWLSCQEHQGIFLLQQNEASDWADIMPRSGFVLYTNALWYLVKQHYGIPTLSKTRHCFKHLFFPFDKPMPEQRRARIMADYVKKKVPWSDVYLSFVNFSFWGRDVDVFGNILACLVGIPDKAKAERIVDALIKRRANRPFPVRVMLDPIRKSSQLWRPYMERHDLNLPNQYHNGGGWPFVAGFWVMLLKQLGRKDMAWKELLRMAEANKAGRWGFYEWFHGRTGKAMGMRGQSWNASMFILAWHALQDDIAIR